MDDLMFNLSVDTSFKGSAESFFDKDGDSYILLCTWRGYERVDNYQPNTHGEYKRKIILAGPALEAILATLSDIQQHPVSPYPEYAMGLDGFTVTLNFRSGFNETSFKWWVRAPKDWQLFQILTDLVIEEAGLKDALGLD